MALEEEARTYKERRTVDTLYKKCSNNLLRHHEAINTLLQV